MAIVGAPDMVPPDEARRLQRAPRLVDGVHGSKRRFPLVGFDEIAMATDRAYLVKGIIPREGLTVVWGPPKCGKTFWTLDIVMHVALAWEYRGRRVAPGPIVYVACEGERGLAARVEAFRREKMAEELIRPAFHLLAGRLDLVGEVDRLITDMQAQLPAAQCAAIVIDTLNRSLTGSESSDEDMAAYIRAADALREAFRCAVVIIHHCGLDDKRPRGHTSLAGAADAQIAVRNEGGIVVATVELMKDGETGAEIRSTLKTVTLDKDEDGEAITSCIVEPTDAAARPPKSKKINAAAKQALELLREAMGENATAAPVSEHVPAGVQGATVALWRAYCEKGGIINPKGNPREQLRRIIVALRDARLIGVWDEFVWPVAARL